MDRENKKKENTARIEKEKELYRIQLIQNDTIYNNVWEDGISIFKMNGSFEIEIDEKNIILLTENILLLKQEGQVKIKKIKKESSLQILSFESSFFNTHFISLMSDCPIIYDFFRLDSKRNEYLLFDLSMVQTVKEYLDLLFLEAKEGNNKIVEYLFLVFLTKLHAIHEETLVISESSMMEEYEIGKFLKYMSENYATITLTEMANHFNFHPSYFSVLFKKLANCSFSEKLLLIKLEQAKRLLSTTELPVSNIVQSIGFKEKSYFYRVFKKYYKMTPLEYREINQEKNNRF